MLRTLGLRFGCAKPIGHNPAESRDFLGRTLDVYGKSPQQQTRWRWAESLANSSLQPKSLIFRENTGKLSRSWLPARLESQIRPVLEVLAGVFPAFGNREISANEHGSPPGRRTQGRERRSCQPPAFGNCWRFGSADFWHTTASAREEDQRTAADVAEKRGKGAAGDAFLELRLARGPRRGI
jgi:hypothetical protein